MRCPTCGTDLVAVNRRGKPDPDGDYLACPRALDEHRVEEFNRPYRPRAHKIKFYRRPRRDANARRTAVELDLFQEPLDGRDAARRVP